MAQFARPTSDVTVGGWTTNSGSAASLFAGIDEASADDADYVQCSLTVNDAYEVRLSTPPTPLIRRGHVLRYRGQKGAAGGNQRGVTVELRQGATVIASASHPDLTTVLLGGVLTLTPEQAATITNYADLRVRFTATGSVASPAGNRRRVQITWAQLRVPDSTFGATVNSEGPTVWSYTLGGVTGTGPSREDALVDLFTKLLIANPQDATAERRWRYAYYARKIRDYVATVLPTVTPATQSEYDRKLANFDAITAAADTEDGG